MVYNIGMGKSLKHKKNFIHTIEMRNETEFPDVYERHKDAVYDHIAYMMESFEFDIDLLVIIQNCDDIKELINQETGSAGTTLKEDKFAVILNIDSFKKMDYDGGLDVAISVRHELAHVYDLYHTMHNKFYPINPLKNNHEKLDDFIITIGCRFWTEFYAYFKTFKEFKKQCGYPTLLKLTNGYEKLQGRCEAIESIIESQSEEATNTVADFRDEIDNFAYMLAKHLAGTIAGKPYNYEYCEKTQSRASFETVEELKYGSLDKIIPLLTNTYGRGMKKKMYKLGKYLIDNLYGEFNLFPVKHQKYIRFAYCF